MRKIFIAACTLLIFYNSKAQDTSLNNLETALTKTNKPRERFALLNKIADYHFISGRGNVDSSTCTEMLKIAQQLNNDSLLAIGYNVVGNYFFFYNGDYSKSLEYYFKALPFAENANDKRRLSSIYIDIAQVYLTLNTLGEQLNYLTKAMENLPDTSSAMYNYMLAQIQYQFSIHYYKKQKYDSALHFAQALEETNFHLKSPPYGAGAYGLMGSVYMQMNDTAFADTYWKKAVVIADSLEYTFAKFQVKRNYVAFLLHMNRIADAKKQAYQLLNVGAANNNYDMERIAAGFLRNVFDINHQIDSAYYYSQLESAMKDSVFGESNLNKIQSLAFSEQLRIIEEQGKQAAEVEQRQQNIQYALIALGIILFIVLFLLLSRSIVVNEKWIEFLGVLGLLIVFEFINLFIHPYISEATNDSPIFMLIILVAIAALLIPLHHKLEKWIREKMVEKNKKIRLENAKKTIERLEKK